ncbi:hypothetical protein [Methylocystis borbori]|uniref:hypothetical protein n=1 Tax=Methylocystis borbori TaxID=3118750 RepID=UPI0038CBFBDD
MDETETDNPALVGEMAHMIAESDDGPRGKSPMARQERDCYDNLLLLCRNHHGEIDRQPETWPVEHLKQIKSAHETWVSGSLTEFDKEKESDDETYAGYIDEWSKRCRLERWTEWSSSLLSFGQPNLDCEIYKDLTDLPSWIMKRAWPARYRELEVAMYNFARVLNDLNLVFNRHAKKRHDDDDELWTEKFYKINEWNPERYHNLSRQYDYHVDLVQDLVLELTRAGNLICDKFRANILPSYRLSEGRLSVRSGPDEHLRWKEIVVEYDKDERIAEFPYPGLEVFLTDRESRDMFFGKGLAPS